MNKTLVLINLVAFLALAAAESAAQGGMSAEERMQRVERLLAAPNPLAPGDSVWIEELTYIEVRDRIKDGATTAILSTGGIEENGPYLATGKHNFIMEGICPALADELGNALCAPIVRFVPEGDLDPPGGAMHFPGTFGVRDETYEMLLEDIATSLKLDGFRDIVMIGDSGGNQRGMKAVSDRLNARWMGDDVRVHFIVEFYSPGWEDTERYTEILGTQVPNVVLKVAPGRNISNVVEAAALNQPSMACASALETPPKTLFPFATPGPVK